MSANKWGNKKTNSNERKKVGKSGRRFADPNGRINIGFYYFIYKQTLWALSAIRRLVFARFVFFAFSAGKYLRNLWSMNRKLYSVWKDSISIQVFVFVFFSFLFFYHKNMKFSVERKGLVCSSCSGALKKKCISFTRWTTKFSISICAKCVHAIFSYGIKVYRFKMIKILKCLWLEFV